MSFTDEVKHEVVRYESESEDEREAELTALMRKAGSIVIDKGEISFQLEFRYADLSRLIYSWLKSEYGLTVEVMVQEDHLHNRNKYEIYLPHQDRLIQLMIKLGLLSPEGQPDFYMKEEFVRDERLGRAYLRGFFLASGSINHPSSQYHLEIRCDHKAQAEDLIKLLFGFQLTPHFTEHRENYMVYLKDFESISAVLNLLGAEKAQLKLENARVVSQVKENVNRRVNFETANLDKTVSAALEQIEDIDLIESRMGLQELTDGLQEIAIMRRRYPYDSLRELGERFDPPLSKSGVNSRLRRIKQIAENIRGES